MGPEPFVAVLRSVVLDPVGDGLGRTLESPPGRKPATELLEMSRWYRGLADADRAMVLRIAQYAAHSTLFGVLCVLDGAKVIEDPPERGELVLEHVGPRGRTRLNDPSVSLHDLL